MSDPATDQPTARIPRLPIIDLLRGIALLAMAVFHFSWDLSWYSFVSWPVTEAIGWRLFAMSIAGTFLFLTGVSLVLATQNGIRWRPFWKRLSILVAAAALISLATWYAMPNMMVRFGILHSIAFASLAGLAFLRLPPIVTLLCAVFVGLLPSFYSNPYLNDPLIGWLGLGTYPLPSVDFEPVFPWFAAPLAGIALTRFALQHNWQQKLSALQLHSRPAQLFVRAGRHSLLIYLVHQPILLGLLWSVAALGVGTETRTDVGFYQNCRLSCISSTGDAAYCSQTCRCTIDRLTEAGTWREAINAPENPANITLMQETYRQCGDIALSE
ncbi:MAG: heparan-alpha-glucosaminide N-acetyltransferase [Stappiaceae bacterium]